MKYAGTENDLFLIARDNIITGDCVVVLWKNYCRKALNKDSNYFSIAMENAKKGNKVRVHNPLPNEEWETKYKLI